MRQQQTLSRSTFSSGIGLHSGGLASMAIHPAPPNTGIIFVKQAGEQTLACPATIQYLRQTDHCTTLQADDFQVQTVEHILSALAGLEIDNAYVEVQGNEIPAADGSAAPFVEILTECGLIAQDETRTYIKIVQPIHVEDEHRSIEVRPAALPRMSYFIDFPHPLIQQQHYEHSCTPREFSRNIAGARTFAFRHEVEYLWSRGLGLGGSLHNTVVFSESALVNEEPLRFTDECVRHKILDLIGDLSLIGFPIIGHFQAKRAGHLLHTQLVQAILDNPDKWIMLNAENTQKSDILHRATATSSSRPLPELEPAFLSV
ncbi:MAG: UDP-3-O-acyl-N-acetylglucosamine deacetylase [Nitrospirota bacterium]|nr:UDP-3-O-acyl-N-acetylglucosamine deacetylase [Nitrospirota bacterium]